MKAFAIGVLALAIGLTVLPLSAAQTPPADFYVSTRGNDAWSGRLAEPRGDGSDGPLATIEAAKHRVGQLRQAEPRRTRPVVVAVRGGTYFLSQPIEFLPDDSGTELSPTIYAAYGQERPVFSGGRQIAEWKIDSQGRWTATLADVRGGRWWFEQLFVNDQRRFRPHLPRQGYYAVAGEVPPSPAAKGKGHDRFEYSGEQIRPAWAGSDVEILAFHTWNASRLRIATVDPRQRVVAFAAPTCAGWVCFGRFLAMNVPETPLEPGQWRLDRSRGVLCYAPLPGERPENAVVVAPRWEQLAVFRGGRQPRRWVERIELRGLTFAHANWTLPGGGQSCPQADVNVAAAISAVGARNIVLDGCAVRNVGGYAVDFGERCRDNRVENCELADLGGGGVKIGLGQSDLGSVSAADADELTSHNVVRQCLIAHGGRIHPAAVGVWIGHSPYNLVEHNDIFDFYYSGVSVGWVWGYAPSMAHHNDVGFNHIHTIGQGVLSDLGGVYTLGVSPGTVVHDNCVHDVRSFGYGGYGLYTDEGSSGIVIENNLVYRTKTGGFVQHYGKENRIANNIFAFGDLFQLPRGRPEGHVSFFFERNIVYWNNANPLLASNWNDRGFRLDHNVYWNGGKPVVFPGGLTLGQWQERRGQDGGSVVADPRFAAPEQGDFRLMAGSPALQVGFKPFDASRAGRSAPPALTKDLPPVPRAFP